MGIQEHHVGCAGDLLSLLKFLVGVTCVQIAIVGLHLLIRLVSSKFMSALVIWSRE